jgi:hypothetical protein
LLRFFTDFWLFAMSAARTRTRWVYIHNACSIALLLNVSAVLKLGTLKR